MFNKPYLSRDFVILNGFYFKSPNQQVLKLLETKETRAELPLLSWITRDELYTTLSLRIRTKLVAHKITIALLNFVNITSELAVQVL